MHDLSSMPAEYRSFGWRIRSEIPLPQLPLWSGADKDVDVRIRIGGVSLSPECRALGSHLYLQPDGGICLTVRDVAAYRVYGGVEVVVDPYVPLHAPELSLFLLGTVMGVLCHQRGELPVHGSCIAIGGQAVIFAGASGVGKSTLAAALNLQGLPLISDDITVLRCGDLPVDESRGDPVMAVPSFPRQKLWLDSLQVLGCDRGERVRVAQAMDKFERRVDSNFCASPMPVAMVCHLAEAQNGEAFTVQRLRGFSAMDTLRNAIYRLQLAQALDGGKRIFGACATVANKVPQLRLARPTEFDQLRLFAHALPQLLGLG